MQVDWLLLQESKVFEKQKWQLNFDSVATSVERKLKRKFSLEAERSVFFKFRKWKTFTECWLSSLPSSNSFDVDQILLKHVSDANFEPIFLPFWFYAKSILADFRRSKSVLTILEVLKFDFWKSFRIENVKKS